MTKNWILYKRTVLGNIAEVIIPICFIAFIISISNLSPPTFYAQQSFIGNAQYSQTISDITALTNLK